MIILVNFLVFFAGLFLLIFSSDWLIQGSVKISRRFSLSPLFIGMVVVAFGTSAPEAGVGIMAALRDYKGIALGNIIGSNIANIALILGSCALIFPLKISSKAVFKRELPFMLGAVLLFYFLSLDGLISRIDGILFLVCFILFCLFSYKGAREIFDTAEIENFHFRNIFKKINNPGLTWGATLISLAGIVWGADLMVKGGSSLAYIWGVKPWLVGITIFAVGTSLPELAASLSAAVKKIPSLSVGNIIGSNIFNILLVLGLVALIRPIPVDASYLRFEYPALLLFSFGLYILMKTGNIISRKEGLALFIGYLIFIFFLLRR